MKKTERLQLLIINNSHTVEPIYKFNPSIGPMVRAYASDGLDCGLVSRWNHTIQELMTVILLAVSSLALSLKRKLLRRVGQM